MYAGIASLPENFEQRDQPLRANFTLVAAQKLKGRWLVDYESPAGKYTVAVDSGCNTQVSVWDKSLGR